VDGAVGMIFVQEHRRHQSFKSLLPGRIARTQRNVLLLLLLLLLLDGRSRRSRLRRSASKTFR
jgi:hypothetical protein